MSFLTEVRKGFSITFLCVAEVFIYGLRSRLLTLNGWLHKWQMEKDDVLLFCLTEKLLPVLRPT